MKKPIPRFKNEVDELKFWSEQDSSEFLDWSKAKRVVFPNLKPSTKTISLRLPESVIAALKLLANKRDVPYQSLLKVFLAEKIKDEFEIRRPKSIKAEPRYPGYRRPVAASA